MFTIGTEGSSLLWAHPTICGYKGQFLPLWSSCRWNSHSSHVLSHSHPVAFPFPFVFKSQSLIPSLKLDPLDVCQISSRYLQNFSPDVHYCRQMSARLFVGLFAGLSARLSAGCLPDAARLSANNVRRISAKWNLPCAQWAGHFFTTTARKNTGRLLNLKSMWMDNQYDQPMTFLNIKRGSDRGVRSFIYTFSWCIKSLNTFFNSLRVPDYVNPQDIYRRPSGDTYSAFKSVKLHQHYTLYIGNA